MNNVISAAVPWTVVCVPVIMVQLMAVQHLTRITYRGACAGGYVLTAVQWLVLAGQTACWTLGVAAVGVTAMSDLSVPIGGVESSASERNLAVFLWTGSVSIAVLCGLVVMNVEGHRLAVNRGFLEPLPLTRSREGWEAAPGKGCEYSCLVGKIRLMKSASLFARACSASAAPSPAGGSASPVAADPHAGLKDSSAPSVVFFDAYYQHAAASQLFPAAGGVALSVGPAAHCADAPCVRPNTHSGGIEIEMADMNA